MLALIYATYFQGDRDRVAEKPEATESTTESYVSDQLAVKTWSVLARDLHEGASLIVLHKAWDTNNKDFVIFPTYVGQDPDAMRPDVWMTWRHELKPPMAGHTRIYDYAEVVTALPLQSVGAIGRIEREQGLSVVEAARRYRSGEPGLIALVLRVYHLARTYKFKNVAEKEGDGLFVPLPFDVDLTDLTPAVDDEDFERRLAAVKSALGS
jgi:hypothetical protein